MKKKLIVFGESNILLNGEMEWFKDVLVLLGKERTVKEVEREYKKRNRFRSWPRGVEILAESYKGYTNEYLEKVAFKYCKETFRNEARKVLIELKKQGHLLGFLTVNPQFISSALLKIFPLDFVESSQFEFKERKNTGKAKLILDRYLKAVHLRQKIKNLGLKKNQVVIISDSSSAIDFPMTQEADIFVGSDFRKENLREVVEAVIKQKILNV